MIFRDVTASLARLFIVTGKTFPCLRNMKRLQFQKMTTIINAGNKLKRMGLVFVFKFYVQAYFLIVKHEIVSPIRDIEW